MSAAMRVTDDRLSELIEEHTGYKDSLPTGRVHSTFRMGELISSLRQLQMIRVLLQRYMDAYPAFRMKPTGAPGSEARIEQENLMALENEARFAIYGCERCEGTQRVNTELGRIKCPMCATRSAA